MAPEQDIRIVKHVGPPSGRGQTWTRELPTACHPTWDLEDYLPM